MTAKAEKIRLTDLAEPELTEMQKGALAHTAANPVTLSVDAVLDAARAQTGDRKSVV